MVLGFGRNRNGTWHLIVNTPALLLQIGLLSFLIFSNKHRKLLISPWFWGAILVIIAVTFPVWYWNYQNDFASFRFQSSKRTQVRFQNLTYRPNTF